MSLFVIDPKKCKRDKICVAVCPLGIIEQRDDAGLPAPVADAEERCVSCGHCVAACPTGALSHRAMTPEQCAAVRTELSLSPAQADQFLRGRRSIRAYRSETVDRDALVHLVTTASSGPSGHNTQPVEWLVIHDPAEVKRLTALVVDWMRFMIVQKPDYAKTLLLHNVVDDWAKGKDTICRNAPHVVLTHAHKDNMMAPSACTIALAYLELAAQANGLGACWAGYFDVAARYWPPMQKALGLPEGHVSYGAMMVGHLKYRYHRIPLRKSPRITWK